MNQPSAKPEKIAEDFFSQNTKDRVIEYSKSAVICIQKHLLETYGYTIDVPEGQPLLLALHNNSYIELLRGHFDAWLREHYLRRDDLTGLWCTNDDVVGRLAYAHDIWNTFAKKQYNDDLTGEQFLSKWPQYYCENFVPCSPWEAELNLLSEAK